MNTGAITWTRITGDLALVTFDQPGSSANVLNRATLAELDGVLAALEAERGLRGVCFQSAKPSVFIAGADVKELTTLGSPDALHEMIRLGQRVFTRLAALPMPKVALIHGACLGGGYELCLACEVRVASDDKSTRIGLPEVTLGILPAWGGCTRLPRLIGLPGACDAILGAKRLAAKAALKRGLVDAIAPKEHLLTVARTFLAGDPPVRKGLGWVNNPLAVRIVAVRAGREIQARTHGNYPAPLRALDVLTRAVSGSLADSFAREAAAVLALAATPACRNLMGVFFLQERARHLQVSTTGKPARVSRTAVIGAGVMGAGIAQWLSAQDRTVLLRDVDVERVRYGMQTIAKLYRDAVLHHVLDAKAARQAFDRVVPCANEVPLTHVDLVIEAAVEDLAVKRKIFQRLAALAAPGTILATNTSGLSISELAASVPGPERVVGIHFFNPVHRMQLVEVIAGTQTAPDVLARAVRLVQDIGKLPVVVQDSPGFLVNRILMPYLVEAGHLFAQGAATARLDAAMLAFGMPMGPLRLIDEVGVDVAAHVAGHLHVCFGERMAVPPVLTTMQQAGQLGRKSGAGFYVHAAKGSPRPNPALAACVTGRMADGLDAAALVERMVLLMVNEGARCLEEGVVGTAQDVDFAMIMGTGFAPFRGGPLRYADTCGIAEVTQRLTCLAETVHPRFAPCALLRELAASGGKGFYRT